jgi:hypothetical protein
MLITPRQKAAEAVLGNPIKWTGPDVGYCSCPGKDLHTTKSGEKDCRIHLSSTVQDGNVIPPNISCFHVQCKEVREGLNVLLRNELLAVGEEDGPIYIVDSDLEREKRSWRKQLEKSAAKIKKKVLADLWAPADMLKGSPELPSGDISRQRKQHFALFEKFAPAEGAVWCGTKYSSGNIQHRQNFRSASAWHGAWIPDGYEFTCTGIFKQDSFARRNENVVARPFLVVEADGLSKDPNENKALCGAVFRHLRDVRKLRLRAVVDTGGKSLHGWFQMPAPEILKILEVILPVWGCDPKVFSPSQPVRLAGAYRRDKGKYQEFCYYDSIDG